MNAIAWIIEKFNDAGGWFYDIYIDCYYAGFPLSLIKDWFYYLSEVFYDLAWRFYDFSFWVSDVTYKITQVLSWENIKGAILGWLPDLWNVIYWWQNWWHFVDDRVTSWFEANIEVIKTWIGEATQGMVSWLNNLDSWLSSLQYSWDSFKGKIPTIDAVISWWSNWQGYLHTYIDTWWTSTMGEVQDLINSAFVTREQFWDGWQDWRDKVTEFFSDPEDWLYKSMDRIVERFW